MRLPMEAVKGDRPDLVNVYADVLPEDTPAFFDTLWEGFVMSWLVSNGREQ